MCGNPNKRSKPMTQKEAVRKTFLEARGKKLSVSQIADRVTALTNASLWVPDPSIRRVLSELRRSGLHIYSTFWEYGNARQYWVPK